MRYRSSTLILVFSIYKFKLPWETESLWMCIFDCICSIYIIFMQSMTRLHLKTSSRQECYVHYQRWIDSDDFNKRPFTRNLTWAIEVKQKEKALILQRATCTKKFMYEQVFIFFSSKGHLCMKWSVRTVSRWKCLMRVTKTRNKRIKNYNSNISCVMVIMFRKKRSVHDQCL